MLLSLILLQAMSPHDVSGIWWTRSGNAQVEIVVTDDGESIEGTVIWSDQTKAADSPEDSDEAESADLSGRDLAGTVILEDHERGRKGWSGGTIYNLKNGKAYRSNVSLQDADTLAVEGCLGFFCRTQEWRRVSADDVQRQEIAPSMLPVASE